MLCCAVVSAGAPCTEIFNIHWVRAQSWSTFAACLPPPLCNINCQIKTSVATKPLKINEVLPVSVSLSFYFTPRVCFTAIGHALECEYMMHQGRDNKLHQCFLKETKESVLNHSVWITGCNDDQLCIWYKQL